MNSIRTLLAALFCLTGFVRAADTGHPRLYVQSADREAVRTRIAGEPWAAQAFATLKGRVDTVLVQVEKDPVWLTSRLLLHWNTHYRQAVVEKGRWVGGEGQAAGPTVRFAGARDWVTSHSLPENLTDMRPYNEGPDGAVWLINKKSGEGEWMAPGTTGRQIELGNSRIMQVAAEAAFVHWITGDERYARLGSDVVWAFTEALARTDAPVLKSADKAAAQIIGLNSFEVIHEEILPPYGLAYDFLHDTLVAQGRDVRLVEAQLKRIADRVIAGGGRDGNWNLNQAYLFVHGGLVLDDNAAYPDGHGRQYYIDILLNADLPAQRGIRPVVHEGYDAETALWPEAPGYAFGTTPQIIQLAALASSDPAGRALLDDPMLTRAILAQQEILHPHGLSIGLGDTYNTRISANAAELMLAHAQASGNAALSARLSAILRREIAAGRYDRAKQSGILALTRYVGALDPVQPVAKSELQPSSFFAKPLNVLLQRIPADDPADSLSAALFGTAGGHVHANGLAIELYGAGLVLGSDPGRGSSYWQPDHGDYYSQPPAHNTVIVSGASTYPAHGPGARPMRLDLSEPASGAPALSPHVSYAQAAFTYAQPAAEQQRTLALIRTAAGAGFYVDVFRSRRTDGSGGFHDYLYHNIGQNLAVTDPMQGQALELAPSNQLRSANGLLKGYDYFQDERSLAWPGAVRATFRVDQTGEPTRRMDLWLAGEPDREIFSLSAPANRAAIGNLPKVLAEARMPTLLVRQNGEAWTRPFVAVYAASAGAEAVRSVRSVAISGERGNAVAVAVEAVDGTVVTVVQDDAPTAIRQVGEARIQAAFGVIARKEGATIEAYLGHGRTLETDDLSVRSVGEGKVQAAVWREADGWHCSATGPVHLSLRLPLPPTLAAGQEWSARLEEGKEGEPVEDFRWRAEAKPSGEKFMRIDCRVPAGRNQHLVLKPASPR